MTLYRSLLYPWGRERREFRTVYRGLLKAKMDVQEAHKTLSNAGHLADTPLLFLSVHSVYWPFRTLIFSVHNGRCLLWEFPAGQRACGSLAWGTGRSRQAPPPPVSLSAGVVQASRPVSVCACLPFVSGGRLSGSDCTLPATVCLSLLFPVRSVRLLAAMPPGVWGSQPCSEFLGWGQIAYFRPRVCGPRVLGPEGGRFDFEVP